MLRQLEFNINLKDMQITNIVQLLQRLELPFKEFAVCTYNRWKPGDENQGLNSVNRDYLGVFRGIMVAGAFRPRDLL